MLIICVSLTILIMKCSKEDIKDKEKFDTYSLEKQDIIIKNLHLINEKKLIENKIKKFSTFENKNVLTSEFISNKNEKSKDGTKLNDKNDTLEKWCKNLFIELAIDYIAYKIHKIDNKDIIISVLSFLWDKISTDKFELSLILSCIFYNTSYIQKITCTDRNFFGRGFLQPCANYSTENEKIVYLKNGFQFYDFFEIILLETSIFWNFLFKDCAKNWNSLNNSYEKETWLNKFEIESFNNFKIKKEERFWIFHNLYNLFIKF